MHKNSLRSAFRWKKLLALFVFYSMALCTWAQLSEGKTYYIRSCSSGNVLANGDKKEKDASIVFQKQSDKKAGQKWTLKSTGNDNEFIIVNSYYNTQAIDAAPGSPKWYNAVQWDADVNSENQRFTFVAVEGVENTYNIVWTKQKTRRFMDKGSTLNVSDETPTNEKTIQFTLEETTPQGEIVRNDWENETVFGINKLDPHATYMPYANTEALHADKERYAHPWVDPKGAEWLSLNGIWRLRWDQDVANRPLDFFADSIDNKVWGDTITVPSCLEMKGYGTPYYINDQYPFEDQYPEINMRYGIKNSVASYRRSFTLPETWENGKRVILHFDGIYSAAYVWLNGKYVGYTEGSNNDAEFDLTDKVRKGENNLAVQVIRFSDGSYLEDQDMFRMSGIHRDVYLYATPATYVRDHVITDDLAAPYTSANVNVSVEMANPEAKVANKQVRVRLISPEGKQVAEATQAFAFAEGDTVKVLNVDLNNLSELEAWTAETPNLYTVEVAQLNADNQEEMAFATKYGFRKIAIANGRVTINGQRVIFRGVNTQDTHPAHGRSIDVPTMLRDVTMMKQANINTVRTSHYPRQAKMNAMFDYYGIYVMDEADVECHYNWFYGAKNIMKDESWRPQFIDRTKRMAVRERNFPSIIFWSLGNESGTGANLQATYNFLKKLDPSRPVHYEGATRGWESYTDLFSVMYPTVDAAKNDANNNRDRKPYFMCEYAHSMGNANGNMKEYWDAIMSSKYGIGGCIWDWVDQSIYKAAELKSGKITQNGAPKYYAGYDFGGPTQGNFVNNGLIPAERAWTPKLAEVKAVYRPVKFGSYDSSSKSIRITNYNSFVKLDRYNLAWSVLKNGEEVETGELAAPSVAPFTISSNIVIPFTTTFEKDGSEYLLNVKVVEKNATSYAEAGYPVAEEQFVLQARNLKLADVPASSDKVIVTRNRYKQSVISSGKLSLTLNSSDCRINKWGYGDYVLTSGATYAPAYDNFRWVENDESENRLSSANGITGYTNIDTVKVDANGVATFGYTAKGSYCDVRYDYIVYPGGVMDMKCQFSPHKVDNLRRIGNKLRLPAALTQVEYYARGPWENYVDRQSAALLGRYSSTVLDFYGITPRAQSCGNRQDLRYLALTDTVAGFTLGMETEGQVNFSVLRSDDIVMAATKHRWEVVPDTKFNYLHLDYYQKGLGNGSCGQNTGTLSKYYCPTSGTYTYTIRFTGKFKNESTGIRPTLTNEADNFSVKAASHAIVCHGQIAAGTTMRVYDLGGSTVATAVAHADCQQLSANMGAQPHGVYVVKVGKKAFKVIF